MKRPRDHAELGSGAFNTTNWSLVFHAEARGSAQAQAALAVLCATYWYPLFSFARRCGHDAAGAEDLTQGFFEALMEHEFLQDVDRDKGRFRSFLLAAFKHFIANQHRSARAQKRGGGRRLVSIDLADADDRFANEPYHQKTAEQLFEHQWALTLLEHTMTTLRAEHEAAGKSELYGLLSGCLGGDAGTTYREAAGRLGMSEGAVKMAVSRLRKRFGELLRQEIARTLANVNEVEDEVRRLFEILKPG